jgi:hypothetical protein
MRHLEAAIEKAPEQPEEVLQQHQSAHQTNGDRAEAFAGLPMLKIKAGNQTIQVLNDKAHLGNLQKSWKANRPYKVAREPLPPQNGELSQPDTTPVLDLRNHATARPAQAELLVKEYQLARIDSFNQNIC